MTKRKKGSIRKYDEWQPEYTPTGKVTKKSQAELESIKAQAFLENVDVNIDALVEGVSFVGVVLLAKGGMDLFKLLIGFSVPEVGKALTSAVEGFGQAIESTVSSIHLPWQEYSGGIIHKYSLVTRGLTLSTLEGLVKDSTERILADLKPQKKALERKILLHEQTILLNETAINDIEVTINGGIMSDGRVVKYEDSFDYARAQVRINWGTTPGNEAEYYRISAIIKEKERIMYNLNVINNGGTMREADGSSSAYVTLGLRSEIDSYKAEVIRLEQQIADKILSEEQAKQVAAEVDRAEWLAAIGTAAIVR